MSATERNALARASRLARLEAAENAPYEPDDYDLAWAREIAARRDREPGRRIAAARGLAAALIRAVGAGDRQGIAVALRKARADWEALAIVLAECADPERAAVVCARPFGPFAAAVQPMPSPDEEASDAAA
jgi:hypothetical protein